MKFGLVVCLAAAASALTTGNQRRSESSLTAEQMREEYVEKCGRYASIRQKRQKCVDFEKLAFDQSGFFCDEFSPDDKMECHKRVLTDFHGAFRVEGMVKVDKDTKKLDPEARGKLLIQGANKQAKEKIVKDVENSCTQKASSETDIRCVDKRKRITIMAHELCRQNKHVGSESHQITLEHCTAASVKDEKHWIVKVHGSPIGSPEPKVFDTFIAGKVKDWHEATAYAKENCAKSDQSADNKCHDFEAKSFEQSNIMCRQILEEKAADEAKVNDPAHQFGRWSSEDENHNEKRDGNNRLPEQGDKGFSECRDKFHEIADEKRKSNGDFANEGFWTDIKTQIYRPGLSLRNKKQSPPSPLSLSHKFG